MDCRKAYNFRIRDWFDSSTTDCKIKETIMSWYRQYTGKSIGRVLHFLNAYGGLSLADNVIVGKDTVIMHGKQVATFTSIDKEVD